MNSDFRVLPHLAVERLILDVLLAAGLRLDAAHILAHTLPQTAPMQQMLTAWTTWSTSNCLGCAYEPGSCPFFAAAQGHEQLHAVAASIEASPFTCPARVPADESSPE
jgi:hypothetical protein